MMKRISIPSAGGYEKLTIEEFKVNDPRENEMVVKIKAFGINYADICIRWGLYESAKQFVGWPITPGFEYSGIVEVAPKSGKFQVGDEVFGVSFFNAYATHITVPEHQVFKKPASLDFNQAAAIPTVFLTAYHALFQNVVTRTGMNILVHSAAGGVGSSLIQLGALKGFKMTGVVGSSHKKEHVLELGASNVICKSEVEWDKKAREIAPNGFDIVLDANGESTLKKSYNLLRPMGKLISYGFHSMMPKTGGVVNWPKLVWSFLKTPRFNPIDMTHKNTSLVTFNLSFLFSETYLLDEAMAEIIPWLEEGKIKPPKVTTYSMEDIASAHKDLESGQTIGKLIITTDKI